MKDLVELALSRRSVRSYEKKDIAGEDIASCVEAARYAPSACNTQPWKFIIVDDAGKRDEVAATFSSDLYKMNAFASDAAAFIVVVSEKQNLPAWLGGKIRATDFRRIDVGIATSHVVLRAAELGIGTCILGWFDEKALKKILSIPRDKKIELVISMGYPAETEFRERRLKDKKEVISLNSYQT